ncbi:MAG: hypothetical protein JWO89_165, partial [Verrucomicrobiaceae bacterium]|nr:hypothetical protein [Verrucomicrobiaceae bacterium]
RTHDLIATEGLASLPPLLAAAWALQPEALKVVPSRSY